MYFQTGVRKPYQNQLQRLDLKSIYKTLPGNVMFYVGTVLGLTNDCVSNYAISSPFAGK